MFVTYLKVALRSIRKQKGYTFINVAGLAIGFACCLLISLWILDELGHDSRYADVNQIHAILFDGAPHTPNALGPFLQDQIPEIQYAARVAGNREILVSSATLQAYQEYMVVDPSIIDVFSFPFVSGDPEIALEEPNTIVVTQDIASRYFPEGDAVGQTVSFDNQQELTIAGVVANVPHNSSLQFDILASIEYESQRLNEPSDYYSAWNAVGSRTYVKLHPGITASALTEKISGLILDRYEEEGVGQLSAINITDLFAAEAWL
jgi:hypothetical protein